MRSLLPSLALLVLGTALAAPAAAQLRPEGTATLTIGVPQGDFADRLDALGYGANVTALVALGRSPVRLGVDGGVLVYGHERRREPLSPTIPDVRVDVTTSNTIGLAHLLFRLQPDLGALRPYADGLFGLKYLATNTSIPTGYGDGISHTNFDDVALSYGVGGGLTVPVYRPQGRSEVRGIEVQAGARYLFGTPAEYLREGDIVRDDGAVFFTPSRSRTDLLLTHLGVSLRF
ncbi:MAG: hypothetical protein R3247_07015 [Rhodothermales bacterium]|nr:hypothetical protein [Rhodothermales bacterium]